MPELIEVESYRRALYLTVGRRIDAASTPDLSFVRGVDPVELVATLTGAVVESTSRRGKLAMAHLDNGTVLGLRFGMTGRLVVDDVAPIEQLEYSSGRDDPSWDRFALRFAGGGTLRINDPRRFGNVELDPDLTRLGPDATTISVAELREAMRSDRSLKAVLLDQSRIAGLGNLLVDEILWRVGLDPARSARSLPDETLAELRRVMRRTIAQLTRRGGSHLGDLADERHVDGRCPRDGAQLLRRTLAGRTTLSCPEHQR
ncbi:MAG: DNA-formamidopyrimidine glycosylase family protein [Acidimicrobiales bacterium]